MADVELQLFVLTATFLLFGSVDGFVYESEEHDDAPSTYIRFDGEECLSCRSTGSTGEKNTAAPTPLEPKKHQKKQFVLGVFFKTNWFRAAQYCRYHKMQLATIATAEEEKLLESRIESVGYELGPVWTSGTDLSDEGEYFWASSGTPVNFTKWGDGQPAGARDENCLFVKNEPSEGFTWHDGVCADEYYFACEYSSSNSSSSNPLPFYV